MRSRRSFRPSAGQAERLESRVVPSVTIQFDYTYDNINYFANNAAAKTALEQAGQLLGSHLNDHLAAITPGGSNTWTAKPFDPRNLAATLSIANLTVPADTIIIYAGATALPQGVLGEGGGGGYGASGSGAWLQNVANRGQTGASATPRADIGLWGGTVTFSTSATFSYAPIGSPPGNTGIDFLSVALHEIGHVLGMVPGGSDYSLTSGNNFVGAHSVASYGGPVPLAADHAHWASNTLSFGTLATMNPTAPPAGQRSAFTSLDWAGLADAGWQVDSFDVSADPPASVTAGAAFGLTIRAVDPNGRVDTTFNRPVTLALANNPGGATLGGTLTINAVNGVATFAGLSLDKSGNGYTLKATTTDDTPPITAPAIDVIPSGQATQLAVTAAPPASATAGAGFALSVSATDDQGTVAPGYTGAVTLSFANNPNGATLGGTLTVNAVNGVAAFTGITIDKAGAGYTLKATATGLAQAITSTITITPAPATHLALSAQPPASVVSGASFTLTVSALAANDAVDTAFTGSITLAISNNPAGGTLGGTLTVNAVNGVATFTGLNLDKAGTGYTLQATATSLTLATSSAVAVTPGTATQLAFSAQPPASVVSGSTFALTATALDVNGNVATSYSGSVALAIAANPASGTLAGTKTVAAAGGVATFSGLKLDKAGAGYTLKATATALTAATSNAVSVTPGVATHLVLAPANGTGQAAGIAFDFTATAADAAGNTATGYLGSIHFTSTDLAADLPADYAFVEADAGAHTFSATLRTAGSKSITASDGTNQGSITLTVSAAPATTIIEATSNNPTYGQAISLSATVTTSVPSAGTPTGTVQFTIDGVNFGSPIALDGNAKATTAAFATLTAGPHAISAIYSGSTTFASGSATPINVNVAKATLTVQASDLSRPYGDANPALTYNITGFQNGDTAATSGITGNPNFHTNATATSPVAGGPYAITSTASTLAAANYTFAPQDGKLTVTLAALTVRADDLSRAYGNANPALTFTLSGFKNGETTATSGIAGSPMLSTLAAATSPVAGGPYAISVATSGLSAANYTFTAVNGALTVTKAPLTITADSLARVYGDANPTLTATFTGFKNGETLATSDVTGAPALTTQATAANGASAVPYPIVPATGTLTSSNYAFAFQNGGLTINRAPLVVVGGTLSRVYGDPNPTLAAALTGFKLGQDAATAGVTGLPSLSTSATAASPASATPYAITTAVGTLAAANYSFTAVDGSLRVDPAPLTVQANDATILYGAAKPAFTAQLQGLKLGQTIANLGGTLGLATSAPAVPHAGTYAITASGLTSSNYAVTFAPGVFQVNPAPLTIAANSAMKTYGQPNPALTATYAGFLNGDTPGSLKTPASLATSANATSHAGIYAIAVGGATADDYAITFKTGAIKINPAPLTIIANDQTMTAGSPIPTLTASFFGFVNGDTPASLAIPPTLVARANASSAPGNYPITPSGASSPDYAITNRPGTLRVQPSAIPLVVVQGLQVVRTRSDISAIIIRFSGPINAARAANLSAYTLASGTAKNRLILFNTPMPLRLAAYDASTNRVTLYLRKASPAGTKFQLGIRPGTLIDAAGRALDGDRNGQAGGTFVGTLSS